MQLAIALIIKHKRSACTIEKQHHKTKIEIQNLAQKKTLQSIECKVFCGENRIRTCNGLTRDSFQDYLTTTVHLSSFRIRYALNSDANIESFLLFGN